MLNKIKKIACNQISIALFLSFFLITAVSAQTVSTPEIIDIPITVSGSAVTLRLPAGSLYDELVVNASSVEIVKGSSGAVTLYSPDRIELTNDANLTTVCDSGISKVTITVNTRVIFTPTSNAATCGSGGGLAGSGGGGGGGGPTTVAVAPKEEPKVTEKPKAQFNDIRRLKADVQKAILEIGQLIIDNNTMALKKQYQPKTKVTGDFAIRALLAVAGSNCGVDEPTAEKCREKAEGLGLIAKRDLKKKFATRAEFYKGLLKAINVPLISKGQIKDTDLCVDVKNTSAFADIVATARKNRIASLYKGKKCLAKLPFKRYEAAMFAYRARQVLAERTSGAKQVIVERTSEGWIPHKVKIKPGNAVRFVNRTIDLVWPASDVHPTHELLPGFDPKKGLIKGETYTFIFEKEGTWEYHDHLKTDVKGTVVVE